SGRPRRRRRIVGSPFRHRKYAGGVVDEDRVDDVRSDALGEARHERFHQVREPRSSAVRAEIVPLAEVEPEQHAIRMTGLDHAADEVEELAVRAVFDPAGGVVLEHDAALSELYVELQVGVAVEVGEDYAFGPHALAREDV